MGLPNRDVVFLVDEVRPRDRVVAWLLSPSNPSARYLTLREVLGCPEEAPAVRASRAAIPQVSPARDILRAQYPQGYWMHPGIGYSPRYRATVWQILILAQLGMGRCEPLDRAVDHLFHENQCADGPFRASKEDSDAPIGLNGSLLWALETLGYGDEPPVRRAWSWLLEQVDSAVRGRTGSAEAPRPSAWVKVLWALNAVPSRRRDCRTRDASRAAVRRLLGLLQHPSDKEPGWKPLTFPLTESADLLQWLEVLAAAGHGDDVCLRAVRERLTRKRGDDGAWPLERIPGKLWADFGELDEANKWITLRALTVGL